MICVILYLDTVRQLPLELLTNTLAFILLDRIKWPNGDVYQFFGVM